VRRSAGAPFTQNAGLLMRAALLVVLAIGVIAGVVLLAVWFARARLAR
jgi:hypothetical protein